MKDKLQFHVAMSVGSKVAAILALLLEQAGNERVRIALAAPSGKAAPRLKESSVQNAKPH